MGVVDGWCVLVCPPHRYDCTTPRAPWKHSARRVAAGSIQAVLRGRMSNVAPSSRGSWRENDAICWSTACCGVCKQVQTRHQKHIVPLVPWQQTVQRPAGRWFLGACLHHLVVHRMDRSPSQQLWMPLDHHALYSCTADAQGLLGACILCVSPPPPTAQQAEKSDAGRCGAQCRWR